MDKKKVVQREVLFFVSSASFLNEKKMFFLFV